MCSILVGFRVDARWPIIVAANRDEFYARPALPPGLLQTHPPIVGGQDLKAGGTWLGLNPWGVVGLTNFAPGTPPPENARSRGMLVLDALSAPSSMAAVALCQDPGAGPYASYNLMAIDRDSLTVVIHRSEGTRSERLGTGWHVIPNGAVDDASIPKVARAHVLLRDLPPGLDPALLARKLRDILADHTLPGETPPTPSRLPPEIRRAVGALCVHAGEYGTRSYSILLVGGAGGNRYWHGEGPPCKTEWKAVPTPAWHSPP